MDLTAIVASSDPDDDEILLTWAWTRDGQATSIDGPTVPAAELSVGEEWTVEVTKDDGLDTSVSSASVRVDRLGGNILLVLVDDLGIDKVGVYDEHDNRPPTPNIDALAGEGVLFRNAWSLPTCSPTRASLLTGRHARRHGIGRWIQPGGQLHGLDFDEVILPEMLRLGPEPYADAGVGKWHLGVFPGNPEPGMDPLHTGFSSYAGSLGNPDNAFTTPKDQKGYFYWEKTTNGDLAYTRTYMTTDTTNDALAQLHTLPEPWFLYVAYNAPHIPFHVPPDDLHPYDLDPATATQWEMYDAMTVALDTEFGRLMAGIPEDLRDRTTIIFMSDNGTPAHNIRPPMDTERAKGSVFEGGVNVPMIVTGPAVTRPGTETHALVHAVDLFHTQAEIAGVTVADAIDPRTDQPIATDGVSWLPHAVDPDLPSIRDRMYTSKHFPNGPGPYNYQQDALRDDLYKVAWHTEHGWWFFEYLAPFDEGPELLEGGSPTPEQDAAFQRLSDELRDKMDALPFGP